MLRTEPTRQTMMGLWQRLASLLFAPPSPPPPLTPLQSKAIAVARVLCIMGVVYVHAWHGRTMAYIVTHSETPQGLMRWVFVELIGRNSVPLLGMISGWLVASTALRLSYWRLVWAKARTILVPMLLWNALAVLLVCGAVGAGWIRGPKIISAWWLMQEVTCVTEFCDINVQIPFLRDLFVCMLLAPVFVHLRQRWLVLLMVVVAAWAIAGWWFPLMLRPMVPLFFLVGVFSRRNGVAERIAEMPFPYAALPFAVMAPIKLALSIWGFGFGVENPEIVNCVDIATRLSAALLTWRTALALAQKQIASAITRFEPYMFMLFCAHMIMIWLGGLPVGRHFGPLDMPLYPLFFLAQPFLALGITMILGRLLVELAPGIAPLLSGGRLRLEPERRSRLATI